MWSSTYSNTQQLSDTVFCHNNNNLNYYIRPILKIIWNIKLVLLLLTCCSYYYCVILNFTIILSFFPIPVILCDVMWSNHSVDMEIFKSLLRNTHFKNSKICISSNAVAQLALPIHLFTVYFQEGSPVKVGSWRWRWRR